MNMRKELYQRSVLFVTEFDQEDLIATSGILDDIGGLFDGDDNDTGVVNSSGNRVQQSR